MAALIEVMGPHVIGWAGQVFGRGDNDDLFKIEIDRKYVDIKTNEFGEMIYNSILMGATVTCAFSCILTDRAAIIAAMDSTDGGSATSNSFPKVGVLHSSSNVTGTILLTGANSTLTVPSCRLLKWTSQDYGNKPTKHIFSFDVIPAAVGAAIYTSTGF